MEEDLELVDTPLSDDEFDSQCHSDLTIEFSSTESDDNDEPCIT